jgi:hypothetical protein
MSYNYGNGNQGSGQGVRGQQSFGDRGSSQGQGGGSGGQGNRKPVEEMNPQERFDYAKDYRMRFGKYRGYTLNQIATENMLYFDWLRQRDQLHEVCRTALETFLAHPQVAADLESAIKLDAKQRQANGEPPRVRVKGKY